MLSFELEQKLRKFGRIQVGYDVQLNMYSFKNKWASEISSNEFEPDVEQLKFLVLKQLASSKNTKQFLEELKEILNEPLNTYDDKLDKADLKGIRITRKVPAYYPSIIIPYTIFVNDDQNNFAILGSSLLKLKADEYWVEFILDQIDKEPSPLCEQRFGQIQLLFALDVHYNSLLVLYQFLDKCALSEYYTDFSKLLPALIPTKIDDQIKCHSMLSKIDLARLFDFLVDQEIVFFDKANSRENKILRNSFIERSFTYYSTKTREQDPVININKSFSEIQQPLDKEEKARFVDEMISRLQKYKE